MISKLLFNVKILGVRLFFMTTLCINDNLMQEFLQKPIHSIPNLSTREKGWLLLLPCYTCSHCITQAKFRTDPLVITINKKKRP